jgi:hypothetical protein
MDNNHISVWGRTLEEYIAMFNLAYITPSTKILSLADGPSTFNLQLRQRGITITSVDPIFELEPEEIKKIFKKSYLFNKGLLRKTPKSFNLKSKKEVRQLLNKRQGTFDAFIADYEFQRENYQYGKLPVLSLNTDRFDLCLCSNLLFIFGHIFDVDFHIQSIKEMLRLSKEVRIFPLYDINGQVSVHLDQVIGSLTESNFSCEIITNDYHVYKNGNRFLRIKSTNDLYFQ